MKDFNGKTYEIIQLLTMLKSGIKSGELFNNQLGVSRIDLIKLYDEKRTRTDTVIAEEHIRNILKEYFSASRDDIKEFCEYLIKNNCAQYLKLLPDEFEDLKLEYLNRVENSKERSIVVASLRDEDQKRKYLKDFRGDDEKATVIASFASDEEKIGLMRKLNSRYAKVRIAMSISSDAEKRRLVMSGEFKDVLADIIASMESDVEKEALLPLIPSDTGRARVIFSMSDVEKKKRLFETEIRDPKVKQRKKIGFILTLPREEQLSLFDTLSDEEKSRVLMTCDLKTQLQFINQIESEEIRKKTLAAVGIEEVTAFIATHPEETEQEKQELSDKVISILKYISLDDGYYIGILRAYVKDSMQARELLDTLSPDAVAQIYFGLLTPYPGAMSIRDLEDVEKEYSVYSKSGVSIYIDDFWDPDDPENLTILEKVKQLDSPQLLFKDVSYERFARWCELIDNPSVRISCECLNLFEPMPSIEELEKLGESGASVQTNTVLYRGNTIDFNVYMESKKLADQIFPDRTNMAFEAIRNQLEYILVNRDVGEILDNAYWLIGESELSEEEQFKHGDRLVAGLVERWKQRWIQFYNAFE